MNNAVNIGWKYYKDYYHGFDFRKAGNDKKYEKYQEGHFSSKNEALENQLLAKQQTNLLALDSPTITQIALETTYPGLMSGTGLSHETKSKGEAKLGFAFDHSTGLPYLPASSVKGVLRSLFPQFVNRQKAKKLADGREARYELMQYLIHEAAGLYVEQQAERLQAHLLDKDIAPDHVFEKDEKGLSFVDLLELELFEGISPALKELKKEKVPDLIPQSVYARDIFFDAYPAESKKHGGRFIGFDFITPHKHSKDAKLDAFTDPTPIKFLKILPKVSFHFQFGLKPGLLTVAEKEALIKQMLLLKGAGAKTNVGYGQFQKPEEARKYKTGEEVQGKVVNMNWGNNRITVSIEEADWEKSFPVRKNILRQLTEGETYTFKVNKVNEKGGIISISYVPKQQNQGKNKNQRNRRNRK